MPAAVVHFLGSLLTTRWFAKKYLKMKDLALISFIGGIAGMLPDADFLLFYIKQVFPDFPFYVLHRTLTHSLVFSLFFLVIALLFYKKPMIFSILLVTSLGVTTHIALDYLTDTNLVLFYPFSESMSGIGVIPRGYYGHRLITSIDAVVFALWISWLFYKKRINDFF